VQPSKLALVSLGAQLAIVCWALDSFKDSGSVPPPRGPLSPAAPASKDGPAPSKGSRSAPPDLRAPLLRRRRRRRRKSQAAATAAAAARPPIAMAGTGDVGSAVGGVGGGVGGAVVIGAAVVVVDGGTVVVVGADDEVDGEAVVVVGAAVVVGETVVAGEAVVVAGAAVVVAGHVGGPKTHAVEFGGSGQAYALVGLGPCKLHLMVYCVNGKAGTSPVSLFSFKRRSCTFFNSANLPGIEPTMSFMFKTSCVSSVKLAIPEGMDPLMLFKPKCNAVNHGASADQSSGSAPTKRLIPVCLRIQRSRDARG
jgi:hypothetical protein